MLYRVNATGRKYCLPWLCFEPATFELSYAVRSDGRLEFMKLILNIVNILVYINPISNILVLQKKFQSSIGPDRVAHAVGRASS